jgi:hypothetical protein
VLKQVAGRVKKLFGRGMTRDVQTVTIVLLCATVYRSVAGRRGESERAWVHTGSQYDPSRIL